MLMSFPHKNLTLLQKLYIRCQSLTVTSDKETLLGESVFQIARSEDPNIVEAISEALGLALSILSPL